MSDLLVKYTQDFLEKKEEPKLRAILIRGFRITRGISKLPKQELIDLILERASDEKKIVEANHGIREDLIYKDVDGNEVFAKYVAESEESDECVVITDKSGENDYKLLEDFQSKYAQMKYCRFSERTEPIKIDYSIKTDKDELIKDHEPIILDSHGDAEKNVTEAMGVPAEMQGQEETVPLKILKNEKAATNAYNRIFKEVIQRFGFVNAEEEGFESERAAMIVETLKQFKETYGFDDLESAIAELKVTSPKAKTTKEKRAKPPVTGSKSSRVVAIVEKLIADGTEFTSGTVMNKLEAKHGETIHRSFCITLIKKTKLRLAE